MITKKRKVNSLRQVQFCSFNEEQHISALTTILQHPSLLEHLHLSGKFQVDLYKLLNRFTRHNSNSLSQPSQLKSLELVDFCIPNEPENNIFFESFFNYFQHIERLKMDFYAAPAHNLEAERDYRRKLVEAIGHQLHELRYLYLDFAPRDSRDTAVCFCDNFVTTLCDWNQKLETLCLSNLPISDDMLLDLCHHPTLHTLNLVGRQIHEQLTKDGWISFARKLKEQEQNNNNRIQSLFLSCNYRGHVTDEVLQELAGVESLKNLRIEGSRYITKAGINKFVSINNSSTKNHTKIELYCCNLVSLDNPHVVFVPSPF